MEERMAKIQEEKKKFSKIYLPKLKEEVLSIKYEHKHVYQMIEL